jgi:hypothetical protein
MTNINNLTLEQKVDLLKLLVDDLDIVLTAAYGATGHISSNNINISKEKDDFYNININTVVITTDICTG